MRCFSKKYWDAVLCKLVETAISVKIWILVVICCFVNRLYTVADRLRAFMMCGEIVSEAQKLQILGSLQTKIYDIATSLIISGVVVIVLSRNSFKHARLKNGYHKSEGGEFEDVEDIKRDFV